MAAKHVPWLKRLTDRLVLRPSTNHIEPGSLERELIPVADGNLEAWVTRISPSTSSASSAQTTQNGPPKVIVIKFIGNAGRAECSSAKPATLWKNVDAEVWTINPFGYGGSTGTATLQRFPEMVDAVYRCVRPQFPDRKLIVFGNSIGSLSAMLMAAKYPIDGLSVRNPVPIHQLIASHTKYAIPSLGLSRIVSAQIPKELDTVGNSPLIKAPALFVTCTRDTLIPPKFQNKVIDSFVAEKRVLAVPTDHNDFIPDQYEAEFEESANWLLEQALS